MQLSDGTLVAVAVNLVATVYYGGKLVQRVDDQDRRIGRVSESVDKVGEKLDRHIEQAHG